MFNLLRSSGHTEALAKLAALDKSQAIIEFELDGTILTANTNFLQTTGYTLAEIQGKHHGMFVDAATRESAEYRAFWTKLNHGEYQAAQFKRFAKGGREIWIEASYNPILGRDGKPFKVVKFATDITRQKAEPSVPMMMRHLPPGSLDPEVLKDRLSHAHARHRNLCRGGCRLERRP